MKNIFEDRISTIGFTWMNMSKISQQRSEDKALATFLIPCILMI